jgi:phosphate transport system permease protein
VSSTRATALALPAVGPISIDRMLGGALATSGLLAVITAFVTLLVNGAEMLAVPLLVAVLLSSMANLAYGWFGHRKGDTGALVVAALALAGALLLLALPEYLYGYDLNGIIHRSIFAAPLLLTAGIPAMGIGIQRLLGGTPSAQDLARYPLLLVPIIIAFGAYGLLLERLVSDGVGGLSWDVLTQRYSETLDPTGFIYTAGLRTHILGTLMLIALTSLISIGPGVGSGIFVSEYRNPLAQVVKFSTTMLRAISVFIVGVAAFSLVVDFAQDYPAGDPISDLIRGSYNDENGFQHAANGSFLTASVFLSFLVIPVIARATEEGLRSVPRTIREGSTALGATDGHTLLRILLPWAMPNIMTGLLLGAAEAAGSVAILLFIAGTGQHGVGPFHEATSLSFAIFETKYGPKPFQDAMGQYRFTAALLLLIITLGLTGAALFIKGKFTARYRGTLSGG